MKTWLSALLVLGAVAAAQDASTAPTADARRVDDLFTLVVGANAPDVRRTGARELLHVDSDYARGRLLEALAGTDPSARVAVAGAIADVPKADAAAFIEPLIAALCAAEAEVRSAAAEALASRGSDALVASLRERLASAETALGCRAEIAAALGRIPLRSAGAALVELLSAPEATLRQTALAALERATGNDFQGDVGRARAWWAVHESATTEEWQQAQISRLVVQNRAATRRASELEGRLSAALRDLFYRLPETERAAALQSYLKDANATVRRLGLDLVVALLSEGKSPTPETIAGVRAQLSAAEPSVRAAAARVLASLRSTPDAAAILERLASETAPEARAAMVSALGYLGGEECAAAVYKLLEDASADAGTVEAAVTAAGRLAERRVLGPDATQRGVSLLLQRLDAAPAASCEALLAALARFADERVAGALTQRLDGQQPAAVRVAAARAVATYAAALGFATGEAASQPTSGPTSRLSAEAWDALRGALIATCGSDDVELRRAAVASLRTAPLTDDVLDALWARALPGETDEKVREGAWEAILKGADALEPARLVKLADGLPDAADYAPRRVALLAAAERGFGDPPSSAAARGALRARLAGLRAASGQVDAAAQGYLSALTDLHAAQANSIYAVSLEALRFGLEQDRHYDRIAAALAQGNPALDGAALWADLAPALEAELAAGQGSAALRRLTLLKRVPPAQFDEPTQAAIDALLGRAEEAISTGVAAQLDQYLAAAAGSPERAQALEKLRGVRARATRLVAARLEALLKSETADAGVERSLVELAVGLGGEWPGFSADAALEEKLDAVAALKELLAPGQ